MGTVPRLRAHFKPFWPPISESANVYPKLAFGQPITDMEPFVKSQQMEGT
jgi:hypothetical protein